MTRFNAAALRKIVARSRGRETNSSRRREAQMGPPGQQFRQHGATRIEWMKKALMPKNRQHPAWNSAAMTILGALSKRPWYWRNEAGLPRVPLRQTWRECLWCNRRFDIADNGLTLLVEHCQAKRADRNKAEVKKALAGLPKWAKDRTARTNKVGRSQGGTIAGDLADVGSVQEVGDGDVQVVQPLPPPPPPPPPPRRSRSPSVQMLSAPPSPGKKTAKILKKKRAMEVVVVSSDDDGGLTATAATATSTATTAAPRLKLLRRGTTKKP